MVKNFKIVLKCVKWFETAKINSNNNNTFIRLVHTYADKVKTEKYVCHGTERHFALFLIHV